MSGRTSLFGNAKAVLTEFWDGVQYYSHGLYLELSAKHVFLWAQAIAFKVLVTIVPIVVLATGLVGRVLQQPDDFAAVSRFIRELLPPSQSEQLITFIHELQEASGTIVGVGGVGLFLSAVSLFVTLRIAVGNAFEQTWHRERSLFGGYLFDVRMVLQVGLLFILTVGLSAFLPSSLNAAFGTEIGGGERSLLWLWDQIFQITGLLLPFLITMVMFYQLYYLVPKPHPRKGSAFSGALLAAVLWEATKQAFTYYATYVGRFDQYGTSTEALGNTFGLIVAFVFWVYFSGIVLMIGAIVGSLREHRHVTKGHLPGREPPPEALPLEEEPPTPAPDPAAPSMAESAEEEQGSAVPSDDPARPDPPAAAS